jgi:hypothetical protein
MLALCSIGGVTAYGGSAHQAAQWLASIFVIGIMRPHRGINRRSGISGGGSA